MFEKIGPSGLYVIAQAQTPGGHADGVSAAEAVAGTTHVGADAHHKEPFPPFNSDTFAGQLFWLAIFFGALYLLMSKVALPRVRNILEGRAERIEGDLAEANRLKTETDAAIAAYEKTLADARAQGHRIAAEVHEKVSKETDAHRESLEAELNTKLAASERQIEAAKTTALGNVRGIAVDAAAAIVERLTGRPAEAAQVEAAVDASLAR